MADVRDLLIRMSLDTSTFKTNIADAKRELKTLKSEYKAISASDDIGQGGANLLANLREQKTAAEALVKEYQTGIEEIRAKLNTVPAGSQQASQLQSQVQALENGLANAQTQVSTLQSQIDSVRLDTFITHAETVASTINNLRLGLGELFDFAGRAADSADTANVNREAAFVSATKNVEDTHQTQEDLDALNEALREMSGRIPQTYQQLAALMGVGATLGVPYEDLIQFTEVMAKLNVATNVDGEGGAQAMAQFLNITEKDFDNLDRVGSTLTELGNNSATTEQAILEMAHRAATGLSTVGMSSADILALSAAINSVGIEAQAGGSAISKLGITMDKAANVGGQSIPKLLAAAPDGWGKFDTIYELYAHLDSLPSSQGWKAFADGLNMTMGDTKALMNSALAAERFSQAMGMTVDEFAQGWNEDSANQMLNFFRALGEMDGTDESENMLWVMDQLGIREIRQSNMVRALAGNWELYAKMLGLGRDAYDKNIALENEANRAFSTNESRRTMNQNKAENAAEAMGKTVTEMRKPWEDFFGDLQQWYADWPGWAQTAVGAAAEGAKNLGGLLEGAGKAAFSILSISKAIKEIEQSTLGAALIKKLAGAGGAAAAAAGTAATTVVPGAMFIGGSLELGRRMNNAYTEETFGGANAAIERTGELLDTAGGKMTRLQELFQAFGAATNEDDADWLGKLQSAWSQYGDELLQLFPELQKDVGDNMDAFGWMILGSHAVEQLAAGIDAEKAGLYANGLDAGLQVDAGIAQGLYDGLDGLLTAADEVASQLDGRLRTDLDINSPSGVARILGGYFSEGFAQGIEGGISRVEQSVDRLTRAVTPKPGPDGKPRQRQAQITLNLDGRSIAQSLAPILDDVMGDFVL